MEVQRFFERFRLKDMIGVKYSGEVSSRGNDAHGFLEVGSANF